LNPAPRAAPGRCLVRAEAVQSNHNGHAGPMDTVDLRHSERWERKSDIYILRSDGFSCARETVSGGRRPSVFCGARQRWSMCAHQLGTPCCH
jgi:hypothetical protein